MTIKSRHPATISNLLLRAGRRYRDRPAFVSDEATLTYGAIYDLLGQAQAVLAAAGFKAGDCAAYLSKNGTEAWVTMQAAAGLGMVSTFLHPMGSLQDHLRQIELSGARAVFIDSRGYAERGVEIAAGATGCRIFSIGSSGYGPDIWAEILDAGSCTPVDRSDPEAIGSKNFTGGTTGVPKMLEYRNETSTASIAATLSNIELPQVPRVLAAGPISHVTGCLLMPTLIRGGSIHMLPGFEAARVLKAIEKNGINATLFIPVMIYMLLDSPELDKVDLSSLDLVLYGGSAMVPPRLVQAIERVGPKFAQVYGQTECFPIAYLPRGDHDVTRPERMSACGFPTNECTLALLNDNGEEVPAGEPGEICVRAPFAFEGYLNDPEATAQALQGGWHHTGDIARMDDEGRLHIVDRKKELIVTGGFNVYPREIEDAIATHPGVARCAVIGVPDDRWGEAVCAYVVTTVEARLEDQDIIATVKAIKGSVHAPKVVRFVDSLPLTPAGKVDKKQLRQADWAGRERMVN